MTKVSLSQVSKRFGHTEALRSVDLEIDEGELLTLLGPSGCGKTTLLRLTAGLLPLTDGEISFNGQPVSRVPAHKRNVGLVFQNYALFPHMTVGENVAFGLRMRMLPRDVIRVEVRKALEMVQLPEYEHRYPHQLSGGQQQRVALARALVIKPAVLLLDEPFGALDKQLRQQMQLELRTLQQLVKITTIFVTHDQEEALTLSDRIAVMSRGRVEQIGTPTDVYEEPRTSFVLSFVGVSNSLRGEVVRNDGREVTVRTPQGIEVRGKRSHPGLAPRDPVIVAVRPERVRFAPAEGTYDGNFCRGQIKSVIYLGSVVHYYVDLSGGEEFVVVELNTPGDDGATHRAGERVALLWDPARTMVFKEG